MATRPAPNHEGWTLRKTPAAAARRRGAGSKARPLTSAVPAEYLTAPGVRVEEVLEAAPSDGPARRSGTPDLGLDVDVAPGEARLLVVRHPSGALTFHPS